MIQSEAVTSKNRANEQVAPNGAFIIFLHIMKSGGMTLQRMLRQRYGPSLVRRVSILGRQLITRRPPTAWGLETSLQNMSMRDRWAAGHFCYGVHELLPEPSTYITMLRDPVKRLISLYYYSRSTADSFYYQQARDASIEQFLFETKLHELDNGQLRVIVGESADYFTNRTPFGECNADMLATAKRHIKESFCLAGITERFDESVLLLGPKLDWRNSYYLRRNEGQGAGGGKALAPDLIAELQRRNHLDCELYDWASGRLDEEIHAAGPAFQRRLADFAKRNQIYNRIMLPAYDTYESLKGWTKHLLHYRGYHRNK